MIYLWLIIGSWVYAVFTVLCFHKLAQRLRWNKCWLVMASVAWPVWILLWALHHSIVKTVDWIEKLLNVDLSTPTDRPNRKLDVTDIPD